MLKQIKKECDERMSHFQQLYSKEEQYRKKVEQQLSKHIKEHTIKEMSTKKKYLHELFTICRFHVYVCFVCSLGNMWLYLEQIAKVF